jgi:mono/diheme cytochrome c family protein/plastocyanin
MTDQPGGQNRPEERLPIQRPPAEVSPADRFTAPPATHEVSLTPERAAGIVRQSSNARWVGFLATLVVIVFTLIYYFYELGVPGLAGTSRLEAEAEEQYVTAVERGYNIYQANCARCHGEQGEGGIGPALNDQMKLFTHLNEQYLRNVLYAGGRYVCGNPDSLMPVWDSENGGPLNYEQINELIAFLRATNEHEYIVKDPSTLEPIIDPATGEPETFTGWRDPNFRPAPEATPVPDCWTDAFATPAPSGSPGASASPGPSGSPSGSPDASAPAGTVVQIAAANIAFNPTELEAPADQPFAIEFANQDAGIPHNVEIKDPAGGASPFVGEIFNGVETRTYQVPALAAGSYPFVCTVHPNMTGTLAVQ